MTHEEIVTLLGCPSTDRKIEATLVRFGVRNRPEVERDDEDVDGPVVYAQDWVKNGRTGIEFGFEDQASFEGLDESERGEGPMLLTQIYFYGEHEGVEPYRGPLPFGLQLTDDRKIVRTKFHSLERTRRSSQSDTWELPEYRITVLYTDGGAQIDFIICMLRRPPFPRSDDRDVLLPKLETIVALLGQPISTPAFREVFAPLGLDRQIDKLKQGHTADFRTTYGFELDADRAAALGKRTAGTASRFAFSEIIFYRERELEARGWRGALPFGICFDDSLEVLMSKVGVAPNEQTDEPLATYVQWHLSDYSLLISYSTIENLVLQVRVTAPGLWQEDAAALGTD